MEFLEALFPQHDPAFLRQWLDNSQGEVQTAIDCILALPPPPEASTSNHHTIKHDAKRPKYDTVDLTQNGATNTGSGSGSNVRYDQNHPLYAKVEQIVDEAMKKYQACFFSDHGNGGDKSKHKGKTLVIPSHGGDKGKAPIPSSTNVCDLTLDSSDDDLELLTAADMREEPASSSSSSRLLKKHHHNVLEELSDEEPPAYTAFDAFHLEQQRLQCEKEEREAALERERLAMVANFMTSAQELFENISVPYLEKLMEEMRPQVQSDTELVEICVEKIFSLNGDYPKAKRKRRDSMDGEGGPSLGIFDGGEEDEEEDEGVYNGPLHDKDAAKKLPPRDYMDCKIRMSGSYDTDRYNISQFWIGLFQSGQIYIERDILITYSVFIVQCNYTKISPGLPRRQYALA